MISPRNPIGRFKRGTRAALASLALLAACGQAVPKALAEEPGAATACVLDGMLLKDFAGPKAQIHYAEGKPEFFCDLMELFTALGAPERLRSATGVFVQDMGKTDWEHPSGHWIDAKSAIYVAGSAKTGSMGPTFGAFSSEHEAQAFVRKEGGKILRFEQISTDMASLDGGVVHDTTMSR
ncbi:MULTISPECIES: nitrous oxide reductase accessory protein NosL [unclassified Janthinobacterium]|uniref:nitrous oxide reductase accessory protein NosL n=1 Tax=unclassified Janthinobacterium TaxID=2610881 RepID=UPI000349B1B6|nr:MULTISPECIES: nitrous oxide reductase accessory protein NosL [unclassified Janthinobacterium]MEC5161469.1 copper chaperone NosL [Janthinobacterium sp. CG_S6]